MNTETQHTSDLLILRQAIDALVDETGVLIKIQATEFKLENPQHRADALVNIGLNNDIYVEVKRHAQHLNIGAVINQIKRLPGSAILAADYINPNMASKLKLANIQFIDTAGNAFINLEPLYIFITGKKLQKEKIEKTSGQVNRAFEPKGLLVTYAILTNQDLLNEPYRVIANATGVALGTVGWVIKALKAGGYTHNDAKEDNRRITNFPALLDRWVAAWPEKLKPKYRLGTFNTDEPYWWKKTNIEKYEGFWGGETAAAIYTNHLKPEITTVYIPRNQQAKLLSDMRLRKADKFDHSREYKNIVELYTPFWHLANDENISKEKHDWTFRNNKITNAIAEPGVVNPVLAYADLIATGDIRNIEAARVLYDERIARLDREDRS